MQSIFVNLCVIGKHELANTVNIFRNKIANIPRKSSRKYVKVELWGEVNLRMTKSKFKDGEKQGGKTEVLSN